jgi:hypothetical protein
MIFGMNDIANDFRDELSSNSKIFEACSMVVDDGKILKILLGLGFTCSCVSHFVTTEESLN